MWLLRAALLKGVTRHNALTWALDVENYLFCFLIVHVCLSALLILQYFKPFLWRIKCHR